MFNETFNPKQTRWITTARAFIPGVIALLTTSCFFICCILLFPITVFLPETAPFASPRLIPWDFLGNLTSLATFALIIGGLVFAFVDYVQNAVQRKREESESSFNMYKVMYDCLMNSESIEARRWVIVNLKTLDQMNNDWDAWFAHNKSVIDAVPADSLTGRAPGKDFVKRILNDFDFIGFVDKNYWKMEGELAEWMSSPVAKVWERIGAYVKEEADLRKEPDYYISARDFGTYCVDWRKKQNRPQPEVIDHGT
jgi:hypothetical protein